MHGTRKTKKSKKRLRTSPLHASMTVDPWPAIHAKIDADIILGRIDPTMRALLTAIYLHGYGVSGTAKLLSMRRQNIRKLLASIRAELRTSKEVCREEHH